MKQGREMSERDQAKLLSNIKENQCGMAMLAFAKHQHRE